MKSKINVIENLERDIADAMPRVPQIVPAGAAPVSLRAPEYVTHKEDVPQVGRLTAEAVAIDYEAAAKEIDEMGKQLVEMQKRLEKETQAVHDVLAEVKSVAQRYRDEGVRMFNRLEECSLLTQSVRETCSDLSGKLEQSA